MLYTRAEHTAWYIINTQRPALHHIPCWGAVPSPPHAIWGSKHLGYQQQRRAQSLIPINTCKWPQDSSQPFKSYASCHSSVLTQEPPASVGPWAPLLTPLPRDSSDTTSESHNLHQPHSTSEPLETRFNSPEIKVSLRVFAGVGQNPKGDALMKLFSFI